MRSISARGIIENKLGCEKHYHNAILNCDYQICEVSTLSYYD